MAVGSQAIEVGCVVLLESGHIELPVSNEFVKNKTAVAMGEGGFSWVDFRTVILKWRRTSTVAEEKVLQILSLVYQRKQIKKVKINTGYLFHK